MASSSFFRIVAVASIALISIGVLAGCSASKTEPASKQVTDQATASDASSDQADSASTDNAPDSTAPHEEKESVSTDNTSDPSTSDQTDSTAVPEGSTRVTAHATGISFAVPESWVDTDGAGMSDEAKLQEFLDSIPENARPAKEFMQSQADKTDVFVWDTASNADGYTENIHVSSTPMKPEKGLPSENDMRAMLLQDWLSPQEYKVIDTPLGQGVSQTYSAVAGDKTVYGTFLYVPAPAEEGSYSAIMVSTTNADRSNEIVDTLLSSLSQAK